jgi:hypothetical protein
VQLDYEIHQRPPGQILLENDPPRYTLTFPQTPRWLVIVSIVSQFSLGTFMLVGFGWMAWMIWSFHRSYGIPAPAVSPVVALDIIGAFVPIACGWFMLRSYRRYGHLPRGLSLDIAKHTLSHRPERNPRWREWPVSAIASVRLSPIRNLLGRPAGAALSIRFRHRWLPLAARCPQRNVQQLQAFAVELFQHLPAHVTIRSDGNLLSHRAR